MAYQKMVHNELVEKKHFENAMQNKLGHFCCMHFAYISGFDQFSALKKVIKKFVEKSHRKNTSSACFNVDKEAFDEFFR